MRAITALVKSHQIEWLQADACQKVTLPCEREQSSKALMRQPQTPQMPALWFADYIRAEPKESEPGFLLLDGVR